MQLILLALCALALSGCARDQSKMSAAGKRAMRSAVADAQVLADNWDSRPMVFSPLYVQAQKSLAGIDAVAETEADRNAYFADNQCLMEAWKAREIKFPGTLMFRVKDLHQYLD